MRIPILEPKTSTAAEVAARGRVCGLAVMAKAPRAGKVKTRLQPPLTAEQAAELNVCFLRDTTENLAAVAAAVAAEGGAAGLISYTPVGDEGLFEGLLPEGFWLVAQRGDGFGERLRAAAEDVLGCGFGSVCLIDSDSPTAPRAAYEQAVKELAREGERVVLGPSADGGYYLIGMNRAGMRVARWLFEGIAWSTDAVYAQTLERAREAGTEVVELPLWYDVDDGATLEILKAELLMGMSPGFAVVKGYAAPHTQAMLMKMDLALNAEKGLAADAGGAVDASMDQQERPGGEVAMLKGEGW